MTPDELDLMESLCRAIAVETDRQKLGELIQELNELLEQGAPAELGRGGF